MIVFRKTTQAHVPLAGSVDIVARDSAFLGHGGDVNPAADRHQVATRGGVIPEVTLKVKGVGAVYLSPQEVAALLNAIDTAQQRASEPSAYCTARVLVVELREPGGEP